MQDCNFRRGLAVNALHAVSGRIVELFCRCDRATALMRYRQRADIRVDGHFDHLRTVDELWDDESNAPLAGGWPVLELDTNGPFLEFEVMKELRPLLEERR